MTVEQDKKTAEQIEIIRKSAMEANIVELAASIEKFTFEDNFVRLDFNKTANIDKIAEKLASVGITDIINKYTNGIVKSDVQPVFILKYQNSAQKKTVDVLNHEFVRMSALKKLFGNGGFQLSHEEKAYFDEQATRMAAMKMTKTK